MKLKKGSAEAKKFMASIRAKKKGAKKAPAKKISGTKKPIYVVILGHRVKVGTKMHSKLMAQKKHFDDLQKHEISGPKKAPTKKMLLHKDTASHNVKISVVSGLIKLSVDEKKFLEHEGKKSKGFKYRGKMLWGEWIVLKEKENGQPVQKFIVDSYEIADYLAKQLNKGQKLTKIKGTKIK